MAVLLAPERAVAGALILFWAAPPLLRCEGLCVRYPCVMASAMCLLPRLPGSAMAERETVLGDGAARSRDELPQASSENSVAEESSSVRAEGCVRTGCVLS